jgi:hypothetical protein
VVAMKSSKFQGVTMCSLLKVKVSWRFGGAGHLHL